LKATQQKWSLVMIEKCHHKLIGDGQKSLPHQKLNVTKGGIGKNIGAMVTFKVCHE